MNIWTEKSIELANQRDYLDQLFRVYPIASNLNRQLNPKVEKNIELFLANGEKRELLSLLLKQTKFPLKDSYVPYLRKDPSALKRNPKTVDRLFGKLSEMGFDKIIKNITLPKEANRQMGPLFNNWLLSGALGAEVTTNEMEFLHSDKNVIFGGKDESMKKLAMEHLGYTREKKGLDLVAKFNGKFVLGEAKFLTDFGGHQNDQLEDALSTLRSKKGKTNYDVKTIAILDGVLYIPTKTKMHVALKSAEKNEVILSALFLRDFLYSL